MAEGGAQSGVATSPSVLVDVVVVSFNSAGRLRRCVAPLASLPDVRVFVVDNASDDDGLSTLAGLPVVALPQARNGGFSFGCNVGWRAGDAPYVLLLNPDAVISGDGVRRLVASLEADGRLALAAPRLVDEDGTLEFSQRRFPRLRSTWAQALFLHRLFPRAAWADELVRDEGAYTRAGEPDWVSGACMLIRRSALERIDGLDERFFLYCEDKDLCRRLREAGYGIRFDPGAESIHAGGASAPRAGLLPVLAASKAIYAGKHEGAVAAALERGGLALRALTRVVLCRGGRATRAGHARAVVAALRARTPPMGA